MTDSVQQSETAPAAVVSPVRANPALQPLDPRPLRHVHHGQTGAMWTAVVIVLLGFVVGAVGLVLRFNWALFTIGCAVIVVGIAVGLIMQKLGLGIYEKKKR